MWFRNAIESDVAAVATAFGGRNALPLAPDTRAALPGLLRQIIASPACSLVVFDDHDNGGLRVLSFAGSVFIRDAMIEAYLAAPYPGLLAQVLVDLQDGRRPLPTLAEIRQANSTDGLTLAVFPVPIGNLAWDDPRSAEIRKLAPQAFLRACGGYRLKAIYYEVFDDQVAEYLAKGGYHLLNDFSAQAGTGDLAPHCRPRMMRLTLAEMAPGAMSMATQFFDPPRPKLALTPAEQRVVLGALDGASDQMLAATLGLSSETVRSSWRSIYQRLERVLPGGGANGRNGTGGSRGQEKRRVAIEYLRQNMHELRPSLAQTDRR
jgi:DNA-binding CsgD family transcriptional regulator